VFTGPASSFFGPAGRSVRLFLAGCEVVWVVRERQFADHHGVPVARSRTHQGSLDPEPLEPRLHQVESVIVCQIR
jgi:hypothetical protein